MKRKPWPTWPLFERATPTAMENLPDNVIRKIAGKLPVANKERMRAATKNLKNTIESTKVELKEAKEAIYGFKEAKAEWVQEIAQNIADTTRLFRELVPLRAANNFQRHEFYNTVWWSLEEEKVIIDEEGPGEEELMFMAAYLIVLLGEGAIANFTFYSDLPPLLHTHKLDAWMTGMKLYSGLQGAAAALQFPDLSPEDGPTGNDRIYIQVVERAIAIVSNAKAMRALDSIRPKLKKIIKLHQKFVALHNRRDQMEKDLVKRLNDIGKTKFALLVRQYLTRTRTVPDRKTLDDWWSSEETVYVGALDTRV
jgi:hypothetical protein